MHEEIAKHVGVSPSTDATGSTECNCKFAKDIASRPPTLDPGTVLVVHNHSVVERLNYPEEQMDTLAALNAKYGMDIQSKKKLTFHTRGVSAANVIEGELVVISLCSKSRHIPRHGRDRSNEDDESDQSTHIAPNGKVLDIHTVEMLISSSSYHYTIAEVGLERFAINGVVDIYATERCQNSKKALSIKGMSAIYRGRDCWTPEVAQSDRGTAIFLSSLRVFTDLLNHMNDASKDAAFHILNLLCRFPPAIRALHVLVDHKTPTAEDCAALSHAFYHILGDVVPHALIGGLSSRRFEGARLLFGLILEKIKHVRLPDDHTPSYLNNFEIHDLRCAKTGESLLCPVNTIYGPVERSYHEAFQPGAILDSCPDAADLKAIDTPFALQSVAMLSGGNTDELVIFRRGCYQPSEYPGDDLLSNIITSQEMVAVDHLAHLCGRNGLSVLRPSLLASAEEPCLTFDRNAHVAVYTGTQPCGAPGRDITIFRPLHGAESPDIAIVEQLIAPILLKYEADGTAVFDASGGSFARRLEAPDEILMFCVDCSSSMRETTDFNEITASEIADSSDIESHNRRIEPTFYSQVTLDDAKSSLIGHESFNDLVGAVAEARPFDQHMIARKMLHVIEDLGLARLVHERKELDKLQTRVTYGYLRRAVEEQQKIVDDLQRTLAGLKTHQEALQDFLRFRATASGLQNGQWLWNIGDPLPRKEVSEAPDSLPEDIVALPDIDFRCPISYELLQDPVVAADGHTYSRQAIVRWFQIRRSSPLTGLQVANTNLVPDHQRAAKIVAWIEGDDLLSPSPQRANKRPRRDSTVGLITITFVSPLATFVRQIPSSLSVNDLYRLAFRGSGGRHTQFSLILNNVAIRPSSHTISSHRIVGGSSIWIRWQDSETTTSRFRSAIAAPSSPLCLVKVFPTNTSSSALFTFWIGENTTDTIGSVIVKAWRYKLKLHSRAEYKTETVWTSLKDDGDGWVIGALLRPWEPIAKYLTARYATGKIGHEGVVNRVEGQDESDGDVDMDTNGDGTSASAPPTPDPLVLKLSFGGGDSGKSSGQRTTRMEVLKQMFEALVNRLSAYRYKTHVGLITFASKPRLAQPITHVVEDFRKSVEGMETHGDTALWDALNLADDQVSSYADKYPSARKRIICLSDGEDTKSIKRCHDVYQQLAGHNIVVDIICLGNEDDADLRSLSHLLGAYIFHPRDLTTALAICEMEPVLSLLERPEIITPWAVSLHGLAVATKFSMVRDHASPTVVTRDVYPQRKEHPNIQDSFVLLAETVRRDGPGTSMAAPRANSNLRQYRLLTEMREIASNSHPKYDCYVSETDMSFWKVVMEGPPGSAYEEGCFLLYLDMADFPTFPPKGRFITKISHPNINQHGRICHSIFDRDWTADTRLRDVLDTVYGLLYQAEISDPVNTTVTLGYHHDEVEFNEQVREFVQKHASKTRAQWKAEILGE